MGIQPAQPCGALSATAFISGSESLRQLSSAPRTLATQEQNQYCSARLWSKDTDALWYKWVRPRRRKPDLAGWAKDSFTTSSGLFSIWGPDRGHSKDSEEEAAEAVLQGKLLSAAEMEAL